MLGMLKKVFDLNQRQLNKMQKQVDQVVALHDQYAKLSDDELKAKTDEFKARVQKGETLDDILVEAFAVVREGATRV
ncbi:hypothetical protein C1X86_36195, partial [Pseudomonas sp. GP01-A3]